MSRTLSGRSVSSLACPVGTSSSLLLHHYTLAHIRRSEALEVDPAELLEPNPSVAAPTNRAEAVRNFRESPKGEVRRIL
jgi:hypothetical protein